MTEEQKKKCHTIIHSHAVAAAAGNAIPVPGLGLATDVGTMVTMAMALSAVFGGDITENVAVAALKRTVLKQPIKTLAKEASKLIPGLGQVVAPTISIGMLESAGWAMAHDLERRCI